jgi:hypothetical protein
MQIKKKILGIGGGIILKRNLNKYSAKMAVIFPAVIGKDGVDILTK